MVPKRESLNRTKTRLSQELKNRTERRVRDILAQETLLVKRRSLTIVKKTIDLREGGLGEAEIRKHRQARCHHLFVGVLVVSVVSRIELQLVA
jgi:hypothetical protein